MIKITNRTTAAITIEDLGITLQRAGGIDSSCLVSEREFDKSNDIRLRSSWVRCEKVFEKQISTTSDITPVSSEVPTIRDRVYHPVVVINPRDSEVAKSPTKDAEIASLKETIHEMNERFSKMMELLEQRRPMIDQFQSPDSSRPPSSDSPNSDPPSSSPRTGSTPPPISEPAPETIMGLAQVDPEEDEPKTVAELPSKKNALKKMDPKRVR